MSAVYLIEGKPHRECECDQMGQLCPRGFERSMQTCGFARCLVPVADVATVESIERVRGDGERP